MKVPCKQCGALIMPSTFENNEGRCMLCKVGFFICQRCGKRVLKAAGWNRDDTHCLKCVDSANRNIVQQAIAAGDYHTIVYRHRNKGIILSTAARRLELLHQRMPGVELLGFDDHTLTLAVYCKSYPSGPVLDTVELELADLEPELGLRRPKPGSLRASALGSGKRGWLLGALAAALLTVAIAALLLFW